MLMALGTILSTAASIYGGYKAKKAYEDQARAATYNAAFAKLAGARKAMQARRYGIRRISEQRAAYAKGGVVVEAGTPMQMYVDTAAEAEKAAQEMLIDYQNQYAEYTAQANRYQKAGEAAMWSGFMGGMNTILSAYGQYEKIRPGPMSDEPVVNAPKGSLGKKRDEQEMLYAIRRGDVT